MAMGEDEDDQENNGFTRTSITGIKVINLILRLDTRVPLSGRLPFGLTPWFGHGFIYNVDLPRGVY